MSLYDLVFSIIVLRKTLADWAKTFDANNMLANNRNNFFILQIVLIFVVV